MRSVLAPTPHEPTSRLSNVTREEERKSRNQDFKAAPAMLKAH